MPWRASCRGGLAPPCRFFEALASAGRGVAAGCPFLLSPDPMPGPSQSSEEQSTSVEIQHRQKDRRLKGVVPGCSGLVMCGSTGRSQERVWTLRVLPLESLPAALTVKGAGGGTQRRKPMLLLRLSCCLLFR